VDKQAVQQGVEKQELDRQARRAAMRQAQHIQAYVSIGESCATLNGGLRHSFSTALLFSPSLNN
jgi:hypothetical protein